MDGASETPRFAIFRARDAQPASEMTALTYEAAPPIAAEGAARLREAGADAGHEMKLLFAAPGFSLTYVWFKSEFPLPRHTHDSDCLYYIVGGSLKLGSEELDAGDGFFIGADVPYTYTPGPAGVEVLEFRATGTFNIRMMADNQAFWNKAVETARRQHGAWLKEPRPAKVMPSA